MKSKLLGLLFGLVCSVADVAMATPPPLSALGGYWYNPATSGQGFHIDSSVEGISLTYYTFANAPLSPQVWFTSSLLPPTSALNAFDLYRADTGQLNVGITTAGEPVGFVLLTPVDCDHATFQLFLADARIGCPNEVAFGPGTACQQPLSLTRLTHSSACE